MACFDSEWPDDSEGAFFSLMSGSAVAGVWAVTGVAGVEVGTVDIIREPLTALEQSL